jgi:hypothetical protein
MEWWTNQNAAWIGAIGGSSLGVLGALIGTLGVYLVNRGKCRGLLLGVWWGVMALGACSLIVGIAAASMGQPFHVFYPLCLLGGISCVVMGSTIKVMSMRYRHIERRRLDADVLRNT